MKAFRIDWAENEGTLVDLTCKYHFPQVACSVCSPRLKRWGNGAYDYPCFKFEFLNEKEFDYDRVLAVQDFQKVRLKVQKETKWPFSILPGGSIGELFGKAGSRTLNDFVWGRTVPQISRRALDLLGEEGIELMTAEIDLRFHGKRLLSHVAIQIPITPLLTQESLKRFTYFLCPNCGHYKQEDHLIVPPGYEANPVDTVIPEGYIMKKSAWPKGQHLIQSEESLKAFVSEDFIDAVKKHNLTGITFIESGRFV